MKVTKSNKKTDFIIFSNHLYNGLVLKNIENIKEIYPRSKIFFYDVGLSESDKKKINQQNKSILIEDEKFPVIKSEENEKKKFIWRHKIEIIKKGFDASNSKNIVYLGGDTLLQNNIDEVFEHNFDMAVTVRSLRWGEMINAEIIFLRKSPKTRNLLKQWSEITDEMIESNILGEQSALNELYKRKPNIKAFPAESYNCFKMWKRLDPKYNKILHYRGGLWKNSFKNKIKTLYQKIREA